MSHGSRNSRVRGRGALVVCVLFVVGFAPDPAFAGPADPPAPPIPAGQSSSVSPGSVPTAAAPPAASPNEEAPAQEEEAPLITWDPYGYIKLDASVDTAAIEPGNFARWVADPALEHQHTHFNITARQTRLGMWVVGPEPGERSFQVRGRVEIDFYGGGGENKNGVQLRHAYLQIDWPDHALRLIGGQTSDVISPLVPRTVNYSVAWWSGNIGYRRPLLSLTHTSGTGDNRLILTGAVSRTVGDDFKPTEPGDAGTDSGLPSVQVRGAWAFNLGSRAGAVGVSSHWGQEDVGTLLGLEDPEFDSWSVNLDVSVPLGDIATFKGEAFTGKNLDDYFGGVGQGINLDLDREVEASGGWASLEIDPFDIARFAVGYGIDNPADDDLAPGARTLNRSVWGNVFIDFTEYLSAAGELSWWATDYKDREDGSAVRFQGALIFSF